MNSCFLELLREESADLCRPLQIQGGMDSLPRAFLPRWPAASASGRMLRSNCRERCRDSLSGRGWRERVVADFAIITVPFPVLRHIEVTRSFSSAKRRAIRQLRYDASAKIFLQFRRRFWEEDEGIFGGGTVTDLPIRNVFYPDHGRETGRGVVLASYTLAEDAQRWVHGPRRALSQALENLAAIHPQALHEYEWVREDVARRSLRGGRVRAVRAGSADVAARHIVAPEGRAFLRRHASLAHAWIQGAIESGCAQRPNHTHAADTGCDALHVF